MSETGEKGQEGGGYEAQAEAWQADAGVAYHLHLEADEAKVTTSALRLLISDEAHEPTIRAFAREALAGLDELPDTSGVLALSPGALKITHTAVKLLHDDLGREQAQERRVLSRILEKLPDEHAIRAIVLD